MKAKTPKAIQDAAQNIARKHTQKSRVNMFIDDDVLAVVRAYADSNHMAYQSLLNAMLRKACGL